MTTLKNFIIGILLFLYSATRTIENSIANIQTKGKTKISSCFFIVCSIVLNLIYSIILHTILPFTLFVICVKFCPGFTHLWAFIRYVHNNSIIDTFAHVLQCFIDYFYNGHFLLFDTIACDSPLQKQAPDHEASKITIMKMDGESEGVDENDVPVTRRPNDFEDNRQIFKKILVDASDHRVRINPKNFPEFTGHPFLDPGHPLYVKFPALNNTAIYGIHPSGDLFVRKVIQSISDNGQLCVNRTDYMHNENGQIESVTCQITVPVDNEVRLNNLPIGQTLFGKIQQSYSPEELNNPLLFEEVDCVHTETDVINPPIYPGLPEKSFSIAWYERGADGNAIEVPEIGDRKLSAMQVFDLLRDDEDPIVKMVLAKKFQFLSDRLLRDRKVVDSQYFRICFERAISELTNQEKLNIRVIIEKNFRRYIQSLPADARIPRYRTPRKF